jgi:hypothetical protein
MSTLGRRERQREEREKGKGKRSEKDRITPLRSGSLFPHSSLSLPFSSLSHKE